MVSTIASSLHAALSAVCPIIGVSIGNRADKGTWSYTVAEGATTQQIADAASVFAAFDAGQAAEDARQTLTVKAAAKAVLAAMDEQARLFRAEAELTRKALNKIQARVDQIVAGIVAQTTYANLRTAAGQLAALGTYTKAEVIQLFKDEITGDA